MLVSSSGLPVICRSTYLMFTTARTDSSASCHQCNTCGSGEASAGARCWHQQCRPGDPCWYRCCSSYLWCLTLYTVLNSCDSWECVRYLWPVKWAMLRWWRFCWDSSPTWAFGKWWVVQYLHAPTSIAHTYNTAAVNIGRGHRAARSGFIGTHRHHGGAAGPRTRPERNHLGRISTHWTSRRLFWCT